MLRGLALALAALVALAIPGMVSAQTVCVTSPLGVLECEPTGPTAQVDLPGQTGPVSVTLPDGYSSTDTIDIDSTGPITVDGNGTVDTVLDNQPALDLDSDANIFAQVDALSTQGDNSTGALLQAADDAILVVDDTVTTAGDNSDGVNVTAGSADVTVGDTRTAGVNSNGIEVVTVSGPGTVNADTIETLGSGSSDAVVRSAGDIDLSAGVLRTGGDQAFGFDLQSDPTACALLGAGSCDVNAVANSITTDGFGSTGGLVVAGGDTNVTVDTLQTGGDQAAGLDLSADPAACVALGVGACDTAFTVQNLTTDGANAPGAVVRAVGDIDGNVGVLTTNGDDSAGLDLSSDPTACAVLGAGGCETSFSVGQLTTNGDGATGALVRAAGPTTANVGVLETMGDNASGLDITADPTACALLGPGQCDTAITAQRISTAGDGSAGALINSPGAVNGDFGTLQTLGADSPGVVANADPNACVLLGAGSCSTGLTVDDIGTAGLNSAGIVVTSPGQADVGFGTIDTLGDNSPGVSVAPDPAACAILGAGSCDVAVTGGDVSTGGDNSPGIDIDTPDDAIVDVGNVVTGGDNSPGIDVDTGDGDQDITVGGVVVSGVGSDGINADAAGCADVNITATGRVTSADGTAIAASSGCTVTVTTLPGAFVSGADGGIDVTSGTGATIVLGDDVSSSGGLALNVDGAAADVTVQPTGSITGSFDLTDNDDTLTNAGLIDAVGTSNFGAGADILVNSGIVRGSGSVTLAALETFDNSGLIDLRDGATDDTLTLPGDYIGRGGAFLGVDVAAGTASDRLIIGGAATGNTELLVNSIDGEFVNGALVVDAGAGTSSGAFTVSDRPIGLAQYNLVFDAAANDFLLYGSPSRSAAALSLLGDGVRELFYAGNDGIGAQFGPGSGDSGGTEGKIDRALWFHASYSEQSRDLDTASTLFGQTTSYNLDTHRRTTIVQAGADLFGGPSAVVGLTAGYGKNTQKLRDGPLRVAYDGPNVGVYARLKSGPFYANALLKYQWLDIDVRDVTGAFSGDTDGKGWGGWAEAGMRFGGPRAHFGPFASLDYADIEVDDFDLLGTTVALDEAKGLRGKAGVGFDTLVGNGPARLTAYGKGMVVHEFKGRDSLVLDNPGGASVFTPDRRKTFGRAVLGLAGDMGPGTHAYIEGSVDFAGGVSGGGVRAGISFAF